MEAWSSCSLESTGTGVVGGWMKCKIWLKLSQLGCSWQLRLLLGLSWPWQYHGRVWIMGGNGLLGYMGIRLNLVQAMFEWKFSWVWQYHFYSDTIHEHAIDIHACPVKRPKMFSHCYPPDVRCSYGKECCCGKCDASIVFTCEENTWIGMYTEFCMGGCGMLDHLGIRSK